MKKKVKFFYMMCFFLVSYFLKMNFISALNLSIEHSGYYFERIATNGSDYFSWNLNYYAIDNQVAYCIEPDVYEGDALVEGNWSHTNLPEKIKKEVLLIAYYGYTYPNHKTDKYRAATQALIWEAIAGDGTNIVYSSEKYGHGDIYNVSKEKKEIQNMVLHHADKPSFADTNVKIQVGKKMSLVDQNNVLANFEVTSTNNAVVEIKDNILNITPTQEQEMVISFKRKRNYSSQYKIFYGNRVQNMMVPGNVEEVTFKVNVSAIYGEITLTKYDLETGIAQGDATLEGAQYEVYRKSDNVLVSYIQTDASGNASTGRFFPYEDFYIKETSSSTGYEIDPTIYHVTFDDNANIHINVPEKVIKGRIKVTKVDKQTGICQSIGDATLVGAQYGIYNSKNILVETLTIKEGCTATSKELPYGNYTVREILPSQGYQLDETSYSIDIHSKDTQEVISKEEIIYGKIKIIKVDSETKACQAQGEAALIGAKYDIYNSKNERVDTVVIGGDCTALTKELPYGDYTIREIEASNGYHLDLKVYSVQIHTSNTQSIKVEEEVIKGRIKIVKKDKDTKSCLSLGQGELFPAQYGVYNQAGNLLTTLTISESCEAISDFLAYGRYTIKEIEPSKGYTLDLVPHSVFIKEAQNFIVISEEPIIKNEISILKQAEYIEGNSSFLSPEEGTYFTISYPNGKFYQQVVTDKNGYAIFNLPYGIWTIHQKNSSPGYEKIPDFSLVVNETSNKKQYYNILNNKMAAYLQVFKRDAETKKMIALAGVTFKIWNIDTQEYVTQYVGGKHYDTFKTDEKGKAMTYLKLKAGQYQLEEVKSPKGYVISQQPILFTIGDETEYTYMDSGLIASVYFDNQPIKGQVKLMKRGEQFEIGKNSSFYQPLSTIRFGIYAAEDILSSDEKHRYYKKNSLVDILITKKDGSAVSKQLPLGKYYLKEIETNENYILDDSLYFFELIEVDNKTPIVYVSYDLKNQLKKGTLKLHKVDAQSGQGIPNTQIKVYTQEGNLIYIGSTDESGILRIDGLPLGKYYIEEMNPATGYLLSNEKYFFAIQRDKEIIEIEMENKKISAMVTIHKIDENGNPLEGVEISIYQNGGNLIYKGRTNQQGNLQLYLDYGDYYFQESQSLPSYLLDRQQHVFAVRTEKELEFTLVNEKERIKIPNTFKKQNYFLEIFTFFLGIWVIGRVYAKK